MNLRAPSFSQSHREKGGSPRIPTRILLFRLHGLASVRSHPPARNRHHGDSARRRRAARRAARAGPRRWLAALEALAALPLVLPPTVLGFFLLVLLGPRTAFGRGITRCSAIRWPSRSRASLLVPSSTACPSRCSPSSPDSPPSIGLLDAARLLGAGPPRLVYALSFPLLAARSSPRRCSAFSTRWANSAWCSCWAATFPAPRARSPSCSTTRSRTSTTPPPVAPPPSCFP